MIPPNRKEFSFGLITGSLYESEHFILNLCIKEIFPIFMPSIKSIFHLKHNNAHHRKFGKHKKDKVL